MAWSKETKKVMEVDFSKIEEQRQRKMTLKQRKFVLYYLQTADITEAAMRAYNVQNRGNAYAIGERVLKTMDFNLILEMAGASDRNLALALSEGLNAQKMTKSGQMVPDLEIRHKYLVTALEAKRKIKNKLEVTGENGQPIRFNILAGHGFIPSAQPVQPVSRPDTTNATSEAGTAGGPTEVQDNLLAQTGKKNNDSNH
jgi:hypothetical protein